jgi:U3 small nucleolar RNA-associated protein 21
MVAIPGGLSGQHQQLGLSAGAGVPLMAAGGTSGAVTVWNLEEKRLHTVIRDAHDGSLLSLHFFAGEPRLMSSAADNSVKQWLFDSPDGSARLLRHRSGHSAPPTVVRYYGDGNRLLSAGALHLQHLPRRLSLKVLPFIPPLPTDGDQRPAGG